MAAGKTAKYAILGPRLPDVVFRRRHQDRPPLVGLTLAQVVAVVLLTGLLASLLISREIRSYVVDPVTGPVIAGLVAILVWVLNEREKRRVAAIEADKQELTEERRKAVVRARLALAGLISDGNSSGAPTELTELIRMFDDQAPQTNSDSALESKRGVYHDALNELITEGVIKVCRGCVRLQGDDDAFRAPDTRALPDET
jgi:hypothetical protein